MIYYLADVGIIYVAKNKLCKAVQDFVKSYDRKLIPEADFSKIKREIVNGILQLNKQFPRCTATKPTFCTHDNEDYMLSLNFDIMSFTFRKGYIK